MKIKGHGNVYRFSIEGYPHIIVFEDTRVSPQEESAVVKTDAENKTRIHNSRWGYENTKDFASHFSPIVSPVP